MRFVMPVLALLSAPAFCADFRMLDFGASCANVAAQETSSGAKQIQWRVEGTGILAFEGQAFDQRLVFTYFCPKGVLFTGDYYFPSEPLAEATASYEVAHKQLSTTYGPPVMDNAPWVQSVVDSHRLESDPRKYMTAWHTPRVSVTTILLPSQDNEPPGWRVAIHFGEILAR
jgi:hypothetical protein